MVRWVISSQNAGYIINALLDAELIVVYICSIWITLRNLSLFVLFRSDPPLDDAVERTEDPENHLNPDRSEGPDPIQLGILLHIHRSLSLWIFSWIINRIAVVYIKRNYKIFDWILVGRSNNQTGFSILFFWPCDIENVVVVLMHDVVGLDFGSEWSCCDMDVIVGNCKDCGFACWVEDVNSADDNDVMFET